MSDATIRRLERELIGSGMLGEFILDAVRRLDDEGLEEVRALIELESSTRDVSVSLPEPGPGRRPSVNCDASILPSAERTFRVTIPADGGLSNVSVECAEASGTSGEIDVRFLLNGIRLQGPSASMLSQTSWARESRSFSPPLPVKCGDVLEVRVTNRDEALPALVNLWVRYA